MCLGFVRSLYELHRVDYSEYHFSFGLQADIGLGPDLPSAFKGVYDFSKIPLLSLSFFNLARLQVVNTCLGTVAEKKSTSG